MTALVLDDVVKSIRDLPTLPPIVIELIHSFEQPDVSIGILAEKVSRDQALAAKTLRIANSSFYGLQHKVRTIPQAITVLGFDSVRALVTSAGIIQNFSGGDHDSFNFRVFWRHAVGTALCARSLANAMNLNKDFAFISGLLHDIGKLVLVTRFSERYAAAISYRIQQDCYMLEAERKMLGLDHAVVGKALAEHWKFPTLMQRAIGNHHSPMLQDAGDIPGVVHVANAIMHALDLVGEENGVVPQIDGHVWDNLKISPAALKTVFRETESEFDEACLVLAG